MPVVSVPSSTELAAIVAVIVTSADPLNDTEPDKSPPRDIVLAVVSVAADVAVDALPVRAPTKEVEVTEDNPAIVVAEAPSAIEVEPTVTALLVNDALAILDNVFEAPLIVLLVNV